MNAEGRISAQKHLVTLAVAQVKQALQLPLTTKEQQALLTAKEQQALLTAKEQ